MKLTVEFMGEAPVHVVFPEWAELQVTSTPPALGSLQDEVTKPATLSNSLQIQVPQFIKAGDLLKVNVATKKYMERLKR
jgi:elongation factor P